MKYENSFDIDAHYEDKFFANMQCNVIDPSEDFELVEWRIAFNRTRVADFEDVYKVVSWAVCAENGDVVAWKGYDFCSKKHFYCYGGCPAFNKLVNRYGIDYELFCNFRKYFR